MKSLLSSRALQALAGDDPILIGRFVLVGIFNTALSYALYCLLLYVGLAYPIALLLALIAGIIIGFVLSGRIVFKSRIAGRFHKYLLVWGLLYAVNVGLVFVLTHVGFDVYIAGLLSIFPTTVLSFVLQRRLVFAD